MRTKKAMELSASFMVIMIISILVFSFGIVMVTKISNKVVRPDMKVTDIQSQEINNYLSSQRTFVVLDSEREVEAGKYQSFNVGILNPFDFVEEFQIGDIEYSYFGADGEPIDTNNDDFSDEILYCGEIEFLENEYELNSSQKISLKLIVKVQKIAGKKSKCVYVVPLEYKTDDNYEVLLKEKIVLEIV
jgi:hypothetical protein